jgi:fructose-bisphosphate aldolase, class I
MNPHILKTVAQAMVAAGKGILAIDESHSTCQKRFEALGVECTEESRREYRELLVAAPRLEEVVSGMILFDETLRQSTRDGRAFVDVLKAKGMIPGIKVDTGAKDLALHPGEMVTEGLDGLRTRLQEYKTLGAQFAKWRAVITIGKNEAGESLPSLACMKANAHALARYAALCQEQDIVPMVEPEIMMDGAHDLARCEEVTGQVLKLLFEELEAQDVLLEGTILKVSMVLPGKDCPEQALPSEVAMATVRTLKTFVPAILPGVVFLSGGQSSQAATVHLDLMNKMGGLPWPLSFSYGRAIQKPALEAWAADRSDFARAQTLLYTQAHNNSLAAQGTYGDPA